MKNKNKESMLFHVAFFSLFSLTGIFATILSASKVTADSASVSTVTVAVPASCTFSSSSSEHSDTILGGQTSTISGSPITAFCNDASGYSVYAIGYSGDSYTSDDHTDIISDVNADYNIKTNGVDGASYWKMKLTELSNTTIAGGYDDFQAIPSEFTKIASYTTNVTQSSFTPVYEVHVGVTQPAGTYTGKVKYTLVHPNTMLAGAYTIAYNANGGSGSMPGTSSYNFEEYTLPSNTFTAPSGYHFAGWCTVQDQIETPQTTCSGISYANSATIPASSVASGSILNLYAYWEEGSKTYMQGLDSAGIASLLPEIGSTATVYDSRDEQAYTIAKLADGKYWMVSSLNLAGGTKLDSNGSDVPEGYTQSDPYYILPESATLTSGDSVDSDQFSDNAISYVFNTGNNTDNCDAETPCNSYYSWLTATAGGKKSNGYDATGNGFNAAYSICPKGWRLPTSTTSSANPQISYNWKTGDWYALAIEYGVNLDNSDYDNNPSTGGLFYDGAGAGTASNFLLNGFYEHGIRNYSDEAGAYWSSTSQSSTSAYYFFFSSDVTAVANNRYRKIGCSVRCIFAGQ